MVIVDISNKTIPNASANEHTTENKQNQEHTEHHSSSQVHFVIPILNKAEINEGSDSEEPAFEPVSDVSIPKTSRFIKRIYNSYLTQTTTTRMQNNYRQILDEVFRKSLLQELYYSSTTTLPPYQEVPVMEMPLKDVPLTGSESGRRSNLGFIFGHRKSFPAKSCNKKKLVVPTSMWFTLFIIVVTM